MKKFALLSDIHSNVFALDAVVKHAQRHGVSQFINLGDILYGPIAPKATFDYLQTLDVVTISGNQDREIVEASESEAPINNPTMQFILDDLEEIALTWMKGLPFDRQINDDIYACHGSALNDVTYLLEDVSTGHAVVRTDEEIVSLLNGVESPIIVCGHSHVPRCIELSTGQIVINPGSVGLQAYRDEQPTNHSMENYSSKASYATVSKNKEGQWDMSFYKVNYDVDSAVQAASLRKRKDWVMYLKTGRCR